METIDSIGSDIKKEGAFETSYPATPLAPAKSLFEGLVKVHENLQLITRARACLLSSREDHVVTSDNGDDLVAMVSRTN